MSDSSLNWFSDDIEVIVWNYVMKIVDSTENPDDSDQWTRLRQERECQQESLGGEIYESETRLQARNGNCGFKYQLKNNSEQGAYDITFLRNSAEMLAAGAVATLALNLF